MASSRSYHDGDRGFLHEKGVKGVLPLGYLPLWVREGVTLIIAEENKQPMEKRGFQQS
jgi:hypothetical protein